MQSKKKVKKKATKKKAKKVINRHHCIYPSEDHPEQEWVEKLWKGEHKCVSNLIWYTRKKISLGLIRSLEFFILRNKDRAEEIK